MTPYYVRVNDDQEVVPWVLGGIAILFFVVLLIMSVGTSDQGDSAALGALTMVEGS